jgi:hypothetical protein
MAFKAKETIAVPLSNALEELAERFADVLAEGRALQEQLGEVAREAAVALKGQPDNLQPFVDACRQLCAAHGMTDGTVDKTLSHLRGVIRAIVGGWDAPADASLRGMYEAIPKDATKGGRKPRQTAAGAQDATKDGAKGKDAGKGAEAPTRPATKEDLIRALFGHFDDRLLAAVEYATAHETMFAAWAEASARAAQATKVQLKRAA